MSPGRDDASESLFGPAAPLPADEDRALIAAYEEAGRTLDDLPYTPELERILGAVGAAGSGRDARAIFHRLHTLRKAGKLPRLGRAAAKPPAITADEEARLTEAVIGAVGTLGQRDQLPYTPEFDALVERFNAGTGRALAPHDVWRLIAKLAK